MIFALFEYPDGVTSDDGFTVVYDLERNEARIDAQVHGPAVIWRLSERDLVTQWKEALAVDVDLDRGTEWLVRCDRVDFPPGSVAYRHDHPGPGIRRLLFGELTIESGAGAHTYGPGDAWFEEAGFPVVATASESEPTAFVRVLLLPREWAGRRTIRYLDPADEERPKLQRAAVLLEEPLQL